MRSINHGTLWQNPDNVNPPNPTGGPGNRAGTGRGRRDRQELGRQDPGGADHAQQLLCGHEQSRAPTNFCFQIDFSLKYYSIVLFHLSNPSKTSFPLTANTDGQHTRFEGTFSIVHSTTLAYNWKQFPAWSSNDWGFFIIKRLVGSRVCVFWSSARAMWIK